MCSIAGIFGNNPSPEIVRKMGKTMEHRGPDGSTTYADKHIAVQFNRLAIIDKSNHAIHPQASGNWMVWMNGCIYNYYELRNTYLPGGIKFGSNGDTEVVAWLINVLGIETAIPLLNGMFVILAYNKETGEAYLCRDRYGIKPMYYCKLSNYKEIIFASEIKGIIQYNDLRFSVNKTALGQYMA